jgi:hypothetical protein
MIARRCVEEVIGSGASVIPLFAGFVLPPELPAGAYPIVAALPEPRRRVTISRRSVPPTLGP